MKEIMKEFVFLTSPNLEEIETFWEKVKRSNGIIFREFNKYQVMNFDKFVNKIILEYKDDFKKFITEAVSETGLEFPDKYFEPLFYAECKTQIEKFVIQSESALENYRALVYKFSESELQKIAFENPDMKKIIMCPNKIFIEDFFKYTKKIFEIRENKVWEIFKKIFHNKFYDREKIVENEDDLINAAKNTGCSVLKIPRRKILWNFYQVL